MPNPTISSHSIPESPSAIETSESFSDLLSQYEKSHAHKGKKEDGGKQLEGTVIAITADSVILDIGFKSEGILPLSAFESAGETVKPGINLLVSVKGRNPEGYYELTRAKVERPRDWSALEKAFAEKATIVGTVTGVIKGGLSVDVGVRAFMPASRSGARDAAEMEKMVEQEILCRIIKLDVGDEDVVVDRRAVAEEEERSTKERRYSEMKEGDTMSGTVRNLTDYGAFVDLGGVDALLHVSDIAWNRINKAADVLSVGQQVEVKVLKVATDTDTQTNKEKRRISVGMKQLLPHPWDAVPGKYIVGERVRGTVTRVAEFGAFVELEPGIEGLIHVSEMSWGKKLRSASTLVKPGEIVDAVILGVNIGERRMSLGLKQALGDPWADAAQKFAAGSVIEGPVVSERNHGVALGDDDFLNDGVFGVVVTEFGEQREGVDGVVAEGGGEGVWIIAIALALGDALAQERVHGFAGRDGVSGELVAEVGQGELETIGKFAGVGDGLGKVGKEARHLLRVF